MVKTFDNWILKADHTPRQVPWDEWLEWAKQPFDQTKRVAETQVGEARISTVFLSVDHSFGEGPPVLFETMIFGGPHASHQWRYSTWDDAVAGHGSITSALQNGTPLPE